MADIAAPAAAPHVRFQVPLVTANLVTVSLESFLYGTFVVLAILSIYLLLLREGRHSRWALFKKPMFLISILLCITCTAHWILTVVRSFLAFVTFSHGEEPLYFYADLHQRTEIVQTGFLLACVGIGDAALMYRLWVISDRSIGGVMLPLCTLLGLGVCGSGLIYQLTRFAVGENVFVSAAGRWVNSEWTFTLATNLYCTAAIGWRVWHMNQKLGPHNYGGISYKPILATVIESAAMYSIWTVFFFAEYQSGSNLQLTILDTGVQMTGISFMLINARVGLGWAATGKFSGAERTAGGRSLSRFGGRVSGALGRGGDGADSPRELELYDTEGGAFRTVKEDEGPRGTTRNPGPIGTAHPSYGPAYPLEVLNLTRLVHSTNPGFVHSPIGTSPHSA